MSRDTIINICNLIEIGCILALGGIGLHAIDKWAKAENELKNEKDWHRLYEIKADVDAIKIKHLEKELEALRGKTE